MRRHGSLGFHQKIYTKEELHLPKVINNDNCKTQVFKKLSPSLQSIVLDHPCLVRRQVIFRITTFDETKHPLYEGHIEDTTPRGMCLKGCPQLKEECVHGQAFIRKGVNTYQEPNLVTGRVPRMMK